MKKPLIIGALAFSSCLFGQEVISSQGETYTNSNASIDFTIGEVVSNTATDGSYDLTQGFHQTNWKFLGVDNHIQNFDAIVYPNPMGNDLFIQTENFEQMAYILYDATGRVVSENQLDNSKTGIDVSNLAPSTYSLVLINENKEKIKTFKLIKTQ